MASKYNKLHSKTVYDFTDDQDLIEDITIIKKESYLEEIKKNPVINAYHLLELAERTNDTGLKSAVHSQYRDELQAVSNE